jgi:fatty-acid desaturase
MFLVIFVSPIIYSYIGFGAINAFAHKNGKILNIHWLNILSAGEGYHKNHHEDPRAWKLGAYDPSAVFIRLIKK